MISIGTVLLGLGAVARSQESCSDSGADTDAVYGRCNDRIAPSTYALLITGGLLSAGGIPLIIYGAKRVPASPPRSAALLPWLTVNGAGLRLRLDL